MNQICDCCAGIEVVTPQPEANRPGLTSLAYRAGTYATFFESMLARLSNLYLDVNSPDGSGPVERIYPLRNLTTRESSDLSIALLDAWSMVADVLTFYQERIANEGYLLTATERLSILELARLVGYKLRPGVSASVYLAFTVAKGFDGTIPGGTRAQSIPGTGETAQFFETSADLPARDVWNNLALRLTRPQVITLSSDPGTDAATRETLYFQGISTNLKAGDALLVVLGNDSGQQVLRLVETVQAQADQNRTEVTLQEAAPQDGQTQQGIESQALKTSQDIVSQALNPFIDEASSIFAGSDLGAGVASILKNLVSNANSVGDNQAISDLVIATVPQIQFEHDIAAKRRFTRLEPWTADLLDVLQSLVPNIVGAVIGSPNGSGDAQPQPQPPELALAPSPLANLTAILGPLALPAKLQPASPQLLPRTIAQTFAPQSDTAPRLLAALKPNVATTLYQAWAGIETPSIQVQVYALRVKAAPFGHNAPQQIRVPAVGEVPLANEWPLSHLDEDFNLWLDSTYDKVVSGSWVVVNSPDMGQPLITQALNVQSVSRADYGIAARVTELTLGQRWLTFSASPTDISSLRNVTVWAQPDRLDLAEEPLDIDVEGNTIELAKLYDGLESGRWIIVSGERTDIPNTTGVIANELVMISGVTQGARAPLCATFPADFIPFAQVYYTTDANIQGDRLVVGELADSQGIGTLFQLLPRSLSQLISSDEDRIPNLQFCDQVQLAPSFYANAYFPTKDELHGRFPDFTGLLVDPKTNTPYPGGIINDRDLGKVFGWRISSAQVHSILTLANTLAYKYDSTTVTIYGNVAKATHGQTVGEVLGDGDGSQPFQKFALHQKPLTYVAAATPEGAQSTLEVRVNEIQWHEGGDLAGLGPADREYVTQTDNSDQTTVVFGNGEHGARVPTGSANIKAVYRYGIGAPGNVQAGQISQLATHPQGAQAVINPLRASGGADRDSSDQARRNTPLAVMALDRLVSVRDYADFARTFAGIGKAYATRLSDGRRQLVHVTIAGAEDIPIDQNSDLYQNLIQALHQYGDPYQPIAVAVRKLKLLVISARVRVLADYRWESVEPKVRAALLDIFGFDRRDLGQSAFLSEAISIMQAVGGVSYLDVTTFDSVAEDITAGSLAGLGGSLALNNFVEADLARVDPNTTDPANRILPAELAILTPDIPDTLILTEITG
jgi:hypothetical protein